MDDKRRRDSWPTVTFTDPATGRRFRVEPPRGAKRGAAEQQVDAYCCKFTWRMEAERLRRANPKLSLKVIARRIHESPLCRGRSERTIYDAIKGKWEHDDAVDRCLTPEIEAIFARLGLRGGVTEE